MSASPSSSFLPLTAAKAGKGAPLVLVHGGTGSRTHWARNIGPLSKRFTVIAVDLPGYGASPDVPADIDGERYIDWVAADVRRLAGGAPYHLVGFSFGGVVSAGVAARHGALMSSLTLAGPGGFGNPILRKLEMRRLPDEREAEAQRATIRHNLLEMMIVDPAAADEATVDIQADNIRTARFDSRRISLTERLVGDLARTTAPLQLIWGEHDRLAFPSIEARAALVRQVRPDLRLDIIPGAGHWVQYERADAFNATLIDFIAQTGRAAAGAAPTLARKEAHR